MAEVFKTSPQTEVVIAIEFDAQVDNMKKNVDVKDTVWQK